LLESEKERGLNLDFMISSLDPAFHQKTVGYPIVRSNAAGAVCTAAGDPHFRGFGGQCFDYQGQGTFYLVRSKYLTVMGSFRCPGFNRGVTICTSLAVRYGRSRWILGIASGERIASKDLDGIIIKRFSANNIQLQFNDGAILTVVKNYWTAGEWYLDTTVTLPLHYKGRSHGLCGRLGESRHYKFLSADDFNGAETGNSNEMGDSYLVPPHDDIFRCSSRKADGSYNTCSGDVELVTKGKFRSCTAPFIPPTYKEPKDADGYGSNFGYAEDDKPPPAYNGENVIPFKAVDADALEAVDPVCEVQATDICRSCLHDELCNKLVNNENFIKNCVFDCCAIRQEYLESWKRQYYAVLSAYSRAYLNDKSVNYKMRLDIAKITLNFGLNGRKVRSQAATMDIAGCQNKGECTPNGCYCQGTFTGRLCEIDYSKMQKRR